MCGSIPGAPRQQGHLSDRRMACPAALPANHVAQASGPGRMLRSPSVESTSKPARHAYRCVSLPNQPKVPGRCRSGSRIAGYRWLSRTRWRRAPSSACTRCRGVNCPGTSHCHQPSRHCEPSCQTACRALPMGPVEGGGYRHSSTACNKVCMVPGVPSSRASQRRR